MSRGAQYINKLLGPLPQQSAVSTFAVSAIQATNLRISLEADAKDHFYSACISLVDALRGLDAGFYTWATVKCYYSAFYSLRALLALNGLCIVHVARKNKTSEFYIEAKPGGKLLTEPNQRGTHKVTLSVFCRQYANHPLLANPIDGLSPTSWLIAKREESNYRHTRFQEPEAPEHFRQVQSYGVRRLVVTYVADSANTYTFQRDHAMLAYPLAALIYTGKAIQAVSQIGIDDDELAFIVDECRDEQGTLTSLTGILRELSE